ncbi:plasmid replication protein RepC [Agrobacterium salinitolerans]|uniref:Plasmid replication protein RepC n=1 Tax=Agrobacterium salinitolerans TaxID=1183413 RepID=A0A9X3R2C2_9HYPH|nr:MULTISPECIES: plasmid replication protein RepC [Agrobacterium]MCZ7854715.1 plasmid replication protein RepC [Agrobacterium salinitolerans]MCZ7893883.1 plasmid replication protein RepC [Agrobacterium salinitolerans]MCZ7939835.1 plasmid replication protein RepC [Agrobacterium salinitolerans]TRA84184.1 replication initiation protein RepC [Agrobacterium salinitolerans]
MQNSTVTTPFGRRPMTLALLVKHKQVDQPVPETKRNKWKLFRTICEARRALDISDRSLTVLDALLSFYPSEELCSSNNLIVFPSNAQLSIRARGMTAATLRRHLAALVEAGLILRRDSPNGKRFARRSRAGEINQAFGFSLAPLVSRAKELEDTAGRVMADRELVQARREQISVYRREITKLIQAALDEEVEGEWNSLHNLFRSLLSSFPRRPSIDDMEALLNHLTKLRSKIIKLLEDHYKSQNMSANESQNERHIQDSKTQSFYESENETITHKPSATNVVVNVKTSSHEQQTAKIENHPLERAKPNVPLDTVLRACEEIHPYGPGGSVKTWRDLLTATAVLRSMLQISPSAFREACLVMGPENAGIAIACIFERGGQINSAGAYLRDLCRRAAQQQFSVKPMVAALLRSKASPSRSFCANVAAG